MKIHHFDESFHIGDRRFTNINLVNFGLLGLAWYGHFDTYPCGWGQSRAPKQTKPNHLSPAEHFLANPMQKSLADYSVVFFYRTKSDWPSKKSLKRYHVTDHSYFCPLLYQENHTPTVYVDYLSASLHDLICFA